ncbi:MAG: hypothetical protein RIS35_987 [Pseudomonadota bacterium]
MLARVSFALALCFGTVGHAQPARPAAEAPERAGVQAQAFPPSSIVVVIRRAYVLGRGRDRYCSPEIAVYNQAAKAVGAVMVSIEYVQSRNGSSRKVGNTLTRFSVDREGSIANGFFRLDTDHCEGITAKAHVLTCLWRDRTECRDRVRFSDSGQIPILPEAPTGN